MTLTIEVTPELEALLRERAARDGVEVERFILEAAEAKARHDIQDVDAIRKEVIATRLAALDGLDEFVRTLPNNRKDAGLGTLPDDAVADVYHEREDAQL